MLHIVFYIELFFVNLDSNQSTFVDRHLAAMPTLLTLTYPLFSIGTCQCIDCCRNSWCGQIDDKAMWWHL